MFRLLCRALTFTLAMSFLLVLSAQDSESAGGNSASDEVSATFNAYIVQSGDSLFSIAQRFNTTVDALAAANNIDNRAQLLTGQHMLVPTGDVAQVEVYEVQPGDTLYSISRRFNTSVGILQGLNDIADSRQIIAGQSLMVPADKAADLALHEVGPNDTLFSLAKLYNTSVSALKSLNGLQDDGDLRLGETIFVPAVDAAKYQVYEIKENDSLYGVSRRFATTEEALMSLNGLTGPQDFEAGRMILVPRIDETKYEVYSIEPGDTLFDISRRFNTTTAQLRALNGIGVGQDLPVARSIIVPKVDESIFERVIVQAGDSLFSISRRYDVELDTLQALNKLSNVRDVKVDQVILVPKLDDVILDVHVVQLGDSLANLAETYETSVELLQTLNGITDPSLIQIDDTILVPKPAPVVVRPGFGFGIHVFMDRANASALAEQVAQLGVNWVKIDVPWSDIEAQQGVYNYLALDAMVAAMELVNVSILLNIYDAPQWSRTSYTEKLNSQMLKYGGPPEDLSHFATFLANLVTRYAGLVDAYEIWKSPNLLKYWTVPVYTTEPEPNEAGDYGIPDNVSLGASFYVPLLQLAYETIKSHDAEALVVSGGLAPVGFSDGYNSIDTGTYLQEMLEAGASEYGDAIGAVFSASAVPPTLRCCDKPPGVDSHYESFLQYFADLLEFYDEVMAENGLENMPIIVTQVGWGTREGTNIAFPSSGFEWLNYTSESEQAVYVTQAYQIGQDMESVAGMFLHNLNGCAVGDEEACFFSLVDAAAARRPVFAAFESIPKSADA